MSETSREYIYHPDGVERPGRLAGAVRCGPWIHVSGQGPLDLKTLKYVEGTIEEETLMTLEHIEKILHEAGAKKSDIVKCTAYLSNLDDFPAYHKTFQEFFGDPLPARTTVGAPLLRGIKVEIDAVAYVG